MTQILDPKCIEPVGGGGVHVIRRGPISTDAICAFERERRGGKIGNSHSHSHHAAVAIKKNQPYQKQICEVNGGFARKTDACWCTWTPGRNVGERGNARKCHQYLIIHFWVRHASPETKPKWCRPNPFDIECRTCRTRLSPGTHRIRLHETNKANDEPLASEH